jgi:hypothetical protein
MYEDRSKEVIYKFWKEYLVRVDMGQEGGSLNSGDYVC